MKKPKITGRNVLLFLLTAVAVVFVLFLKKIALFMVLLGIGFFSNLILFKFKIPLNITINFFLSIFIIHNYSFAHFIIFFLAAEFLPRPFTGIGIPGTAYFGYGVWVVLALISANFPDSFILSGILITLFRYLFVMTTHVISGSSVVVALVRNLPQPTVNILSFIYITPKLLALL